MAMPPIGGDRGIKGALYDSHEIVFITEDMRVVAKSRLCTTVNNVVPQGVWNAFNIRLPDLKYIENILHIQVQIVPDPLDLMGPINKKIVGNVVGMSLYQSHATLTVSLVCVDVVAVGPP